MIEFNEYLYKYCLHDCFLNKILLQDSKIIFCFQSGVYEIDPLGKEMRLTTPCRMVLEIEKTDSEKIFNFFDISRICKKQIKDIDFDEFLKKLKQNRMDIDMNFYSRFCNTILIKGYINRERYEISISDIRKIEFDFT